MPSSVTIPTIGKPKTAKDAIIPILSGEGPLTAKKIYNNLRKKYGLTISYQAVHKLIGQMVDDGIISRNAKEYSLNQDWLKGTMNFYERLNAKIDNPEKPSLDDVLEKDLTELKFDNLFEFYRCALNAIEKIVERTPGETCVNEFRHMYWSLAGSKKEQEQFKRILSLHPKSFFLCRGDTFADRMLAGFYKAFGAQVRTGMDCANNCDIMAGGGYVIQIFFNKGLNDELDRLYESLKEIDSADIGRLYNHIFEKKVSISMIVKKDSQLAAEIIENGIKHFDGSMTVNPQENMTFDTIFNLDRFLVGVLEQMVDSGIRTFFLEWDHLWVPLFLDKETYQKIRQIAAKTRFYVAIHSDSPIDRCCLNFWRKSTNTVKVRIGVGSESTFCVAGDYVMQIFYPRNLMEKIDMVYTSVQSMEELDITSLFRTIFELKTEIPVTINMNPVLAKQTRERIMGYVKADA